MSTSTSQQIDATTIEYRWMLHDFVNRLQFLSVCDQLASDLFTLCLPKKAEFFLVLFPYEEQYGSSLSLLVPAIYEKRALQVKKATFFVLTSNNREILTKSECKFFVHLFLRTIGVNKTFAVLYVSGHKDVNLADGLRDCTQRLNVDALMNAANNEALTFVLRITCLSSIVVPISTVFRPQLGTKRTFVNFHVDYFA